MDVDRLCYRVPEAAEAIGVGRSKTYELIASGNLPSIRIGGSIRIPVSALRAWIAAQTDRSQEHSTARGTGACEAPTAARCPLG